MGIRRCGVGGARLVWPEMTALSKSESPERAGLAPYACDWRASRGRRHAELGGLASEARDEGLGIGEAGGGEREDGHEEKLDEREPLRK